MAESSKLPPSDDSGPRSPVTPSEGIAQPHPDEDPADGRSALMEHLARASPPGTPEAERSRLLVEALASAVAGADGRSALLEQFASAPVTGGDAAELTRLAADLLTVNAPGADGRSALLEQLVKELPAQAADGGAQPTVANLLASLLAAPEGRSALLQQLARAGGAEAATRAQPEKARPSAPPKELAPGMVVGRFEMVKEIGSGGFGVVFEARDRDLGRSVAFKAVRPGVRTRQLDAMLLKEAESAASLQHENIVSIFDYGQSEAGPYLVLELLKGETLAGRLARGPLSVNEAVHVGTQVARALAHAHGAGLLHRDLKPGNVFLTQSGGVKVMDLGLAHFFGQPTGLSGTPAYMAPEQWKGEAQDGRTDVFALGVTLFEMLAARRPYEVRADRSTVLDPGPEPRLDAPRAPPRLRKLVERCIAKDPAKRPASARAVQEELLAVERALQAGPARRARWKVAAGVALLLLVAAAGGTWWRYFRPPDERVPLAVADFDDRTGEAGLDGLSSLLITSLEQSPVLEVLPRSRMRDLLRGAGKEAVERIDETLARQVSALAGSRALLLATLHKFGEVYAMEVRAVEPGTDRQLFSLREQARGKDSLPELIDRVSAGVRRSLHERSATIKSDSVRIAEAVTPNVDAWQHYFKGMDCYEGLIYAETYGECQPHFQKALAIDPNFALAHFQVAYLSFWEGQPRKVQKAALAPALEHVDRLPVKERLRVRGWAAYLDGRDGEAKALLRQAAEAVPEDKVGWYLAAEIPFHRDEFAEAIPLFEKVHQLEPGWLTPAQHLVFALGSTGQVEKLRPIASRLEKLGAKPGPLVELCQAYLWIDPPKAIPTCERAITAGAGPVGNGFLAIALLNRGERTRLEAHLEKMGEGSSGRTFEWYMGMLLRGQEGRWGEVHRIAQSAGDPDDLWFHSTHAEQLVGLGDVDRLWRASVRAAAIDPFGASHLAVHLAYAGDLPHAAELAQYLPAGSPRVAVYDAVKTWRQGDLPGAIGKLQVLAASNRMGGDPSIPFPQYLLGEALAEAGRDAEAAKALQSFVEIPLHYPSWEYPRSLYYLARSQQRLGQTVAARENIGRLLELWKRADPEQPLLADARALGSSLGVR